MSIMDDMRNRKFANPDLIARTLTAISIWCCAAR
jgi:hypothetical protein